METEQQQQNIESHLFTDEIREKLVQTKPPDVPNPAPQPPTGFEYNMFLRCPYPITVVYADSVRNFYRGSVPQSRIVPPQ